MTDGNRKNVRKQLASILSTALTGSGKPAQAVYPYQVADFKGQSPVVTITSGGSLRSGLAVASSTAKYLINIHVFVLYATKDKKWNEAQAEDTLDDTEALITSTLDANQTNAYWQSIIQSVPSRTTGVVIAGEEYRTEVIQLEVQ